jgi:hypothetical protein
MHMHSLEAKQRSADSSLFGRRQTWFAFAMEALLTLNYQEVAA